MSKVKVKSGHTHNPSKHTLTWNACDDKLQECIDRNKFVKQVRNKLAKKRFKKLKGIKG